MPEQHYSAGDCPKQPDDLVERLQAWRVANPLPPPTGQVADKAFFDWLSGEEDIGNVR
jgi:antitoxin VapB